MKQANTSLILIIPSASYRTSPFMASVSKLELKVLVLTDKSQVFSEYYPDNVITMNFEDWQSHIENIREWSVKHDLKAVIGVDEESIVLAAKLSELLGLKHNSLESVKLTKDKYLMRKALKDFGLKSQWFKRFSVHQPMEELLTEISFPCILKPTFLSASQGVVRADNNKEFIKGTNMLVELLAQKEIKRQGGDQANWFLVEEFIPGKEVSLEGIVSNGKLKELAIFDKPETLDGPTFPETILITPTLLEEHLQVSLIKTAQTALEALGIINGPVHVEFRINNNGNYILECAARSIGGLCSKVLEFKGGMSLEELILRSSLGKNIEKSNFVGMVKGVMMMPIEKKGIFKEIRGADAALAIKGITELQITIKSGDLLEPLPEGGRYPGFLFAEGKNQKEVLKVLKKAWAKIEIISDNI